MSTLRVTYRKSKIGYAKDQKATLAALGLRKLNHTVEHQNTSSIRGMVHKVRHLVSVEGIPADTPEGMAVLVRATAEAES
ncbi:MAG: 50S ribosomal protein L30 [Candidatus Dormibacteraeota bacterium]|uniref:50S ribosomal protein L30 n=1 Tax=Candidatus Aeolococcus gillhamiae TaxID=3127015 RepID=A0A2W5ZE57_9BACT|nr:50S ribosomal protein L30 [Candidatus Dormibacteraeota bacterium]PZR81106.1 MAG: 50S ribosomal protein L30 [Candidatus Dormibacter sp. RRmetagenome_bin12]